MPKTRYQSKAFSESSRLTIKTANEIIAEYQAQGYMLTLRQLYYQFVARGIIPNNMQSYKRIGSIVNDARIAGRDREDAEVLLRQRGGRGQSDMRSARFCS